MRIRIYFILFIVLFWCGSGIQAAPDVFSQSKIELRERVYHDRNGAEKGTFYCGCQWQWAGRTGGRVNLASCGYQVRKQVDRAERIEWKHVVPAWVIGHQRQCWQNGGRKNCVSDDPVFRIMEADMHNLVPSIGEANADRNNYKFGMLPSTQKQHGQCDFKIDFSDQVVEPRDQVKGQIARVYFYMHDRYDLRMSRQQQQLFLAWHKQYPPTEWETAHSDHNGS